MGPGVNVVQVLPRTEIARYRGDRLWPTGQWTEALVDDELLALLMSDEHMQVRMLDASAQVYRGLKLAEDELESANLAKSIADARVQVATATYDAAKARAADYVSPPPFVPPTPMRDAAIAAGVIRADTPAAAAAPVAAPASQATQAPPPASARPAEVQQYRRR